MKQAFCLLAVVLAFVIFSRVSIAVQNDSADSLVSAIDVALLLAGGKNEADVAQLLSQQTNFRREDALRQGKSDRQIIEDLAANLGSFRTPDLKISGDYQISADKNFSHAQYLLAARQYSLAMQYSKDDLQLYKSRAATYGQFLISGMPQTDKGAGRTPEALSQSKARALLCHCLYADYLQALKINKSNEQNNITQLNVLKNNITADKTDYEKTSDVTPYHVKSAQQTYNTRLQRKLYQTQRSFYQTSAQINKQMEAYQSVCREDNTLTGQ